MRKVDLRMNELEKYEVIKKVVYGKISKNTDGCFCLLLVWKVKSLFTRRN